MSIEGLGRFDGVGEHGGVAGTPGHRSQDLGNAHSVLAMGPGPRIIGRERKRGKRPMAAPKRDAVPRAWQRMLSGRRLDLLDPSPLDIEIEDIAHGLARVARWNGQTNGAHIYSVAQHSLFVEALARARTPRLDDRCRLAILLHDAPEYVIGDMISPFKTVIGDAYKAI